MKAKARQWDRTVKIGRTHLMDATPIRVGQEFSGFAAQAAYGVKRAERAMIRLAENLPIGGTAVGTGINTHPRFGKLVSARLAKATGVKFAEAANHYEAQATRDCVVEASGELKTIAVSLSKIANDIRWLGSGPRCGLGEARAKRDAASGKLPFPAYRGPSQKATWLVSVGDLATFIDAQREKAMTMIEKMRTDGKLIA